MPAQNRRLDWVGGGEYSSCSLCSLHGPPSINFYTPANPIMSSWCKWLDEKRLFTASLYMHMQKKKQLKWAQSTQGWGVGFASEASKKNRIYRLLTASLFTCTQKKNQGKQVQSMQGWGVRLGSGVGLVVSASVASVGEAQGY